MREVFLPQRIEELWEILKREPETEIYAGGTDLLVKMRSGQVNPPSLVCLERIESLRGIFDKGKEVFIGACNTHSNLLEDPVIRKEFPGLARGIDVLGSPPIRHMGTIGGNIVTASPAGDTLPSLYVLDAEVEVRSKAQKRRLPLRDFILGPGMVALHPQEVLWGIWLKKQQSWNVHHYEKVGRRKALACSIASMAALLELSESGTVVKARLAWGSVGPTILSFSHVDNNLIGQLLSIETLSSLAKQVELSVSPIDDLRASAQYRRTVSGLLLLRLLYYSPSFRQECDSRKENSMSQDIHCT
jgi:xanthine dehydrogenase FAD-binding subunit